MFLFKKCIYFYVPSVKYYKLQELQGVDHYFHFSFRKLFHVNGEYYTIMHKIAYVRNLS